MFRISELMTEIMRNIQETKKEYPTKREKTNKKEKYLSTRIFLFNSNINKLYYYD